MRASELVAVKKSSDGEFECDFVEASALSKAKAEELHRLDVNLGEKRSEAKAKPRHQVATDLLPKPTRRGEIELPGLPEIGDLDREDPDTPAYFRRLAPQTSS